MEREQTKGPRFDNVINNRNNASIVIKSGVFLVNKKGKIGWSNKIRIVYICEDGIFYYPYPKDKALLEYPYLKTMKENLTNVSGNLNQDLLKFKEYTVEFEDKFFKKQKYKQNLEIKTCEIKNISNDSKDSDYDKKFKYCVLILGKDKSDKKQKSQKWVTDFHNDFYFKYFKNIFDFIKNPPLAPKINTLNNSHNINNNIQNNSNNNINLVKSNKISQEIHSNQNNPMIVNQTENQKSANNNQKIHQESRSIEKKNNQENLQQMNKSLINSPSPIKNHHQTQVASQKTMMNQTNSQNNNLGSNEDQKLSDSVMKKMDDTQIEPAEKVLFQEIYFQNLFRVHNYMCVHLNYVNNYLHDNNIYNNLLNPNNLSNEYDASPNKEIYKIERQNIEKNLTLVKNFTLELEWLIFETYSLFKNFCIGVAKKLVHEFPVENNSNKIFPLMIPSYEKIKNPKHAAYFYFLSKINVHFTLTWDKVLCKKEKNLNKNEENKKKGGEDFSIFFNGKWKFLRKEFKNRDFFIDLITLFNLKSTKLDKFPCIPMTCIVDYHGFRIYCESVVPKNDKFFKKTLNPLESMNLSVGEKQKYEGYYKSVDLFSNEFYDLDTKRKDQINELEFIENQENIFSKDKKDKEGKAKFDIKSIENLFIAKTKNLTSVYNLIYNQQKGVYNYSAPSTNLNQVDKDSIKLLNDKFEKITQSFYLDIQKKIDEFISLLKESKNVNLINQNLNNIGNDNLDYHNNFNRVQTGNNFNSNLNHVKSENFINFNFLDEFCSENIENNNDDSRIEDAMDNSYIQNDNINNNVSGKFYKKISKINLRNTNVNFKNNVNIQDNNINILNNLVNQNLTNNINNLYFNNNKNDDDQNSISLNEGISDVLQENDYKHYKFLEDILETKYEKEGKNKLNNENYKEISKDIFIKVFQTYSRFNKNFEYNSKKSLDYNNFIPGANKADRNENFQNFIQEDVYIYPMKYNFLLTNSPDDRINEKDRRDNNSKFPYHYYRPEYVFYYFKNLQANLDSYKNITEEEKNNRKRLNEDFIYFLKEILMNNQDSKAKNLEELKSNFYEKHIYYFTKSLDNLCYVPTDSEQLTEIFHANGINMFFLGKVAELTNVPHVRELCIIEMIARICKRYIYQILSSKKITLMNKYYQEKNYDNYLNVQKKDYTNKEKESDLGQKNKDIAYLEGVPTNAYFKVGGMNSQDFENVIQNSTNKQIQKRTELDPKSIKYLLSDQYSTDGIGVNNTNIQNNEAYIKTKNQILPVYNNADEMKETVKFLNILFNLSNGNSPIPINNVVNNNQNISSNNTGSNQNLTNNPVPNTNSNNSDVPNRLNVGNNTTNNMSGSGSTSNQSNSFNSNNNIGNNPSSANIANSNNNRPIANNEIEIFDERLNHNKLWQKIIEEIKRKFFLDNEYILEIIKNKYFSNIMLFHSILHNSGLKFIGESKNLCEDVYSYSNFTIEFRETIFQTKPKIKCCKFRNFFSNKVYKNTLLNIYEESLFVDDFKNRIPVKNMIFRNFIEHLCHTNTDFTEFSMIFFESLNRISIKKFDVSTFETTIISLLKKYDKDRNISNTHLSNKGFDSRLFQELKHNFYKFNSVLVNFSYKLTEIRNFSSSHNITNGSNNKIDQNTSNLLRNYKNKIKNFYYETHYFQGIADLIFARIYYKKYENFKNDHSHFYNTAMNSYLYCLKILNNALGTKSIFVGNLNLEIGKIFMIHGDYLKSISFYTNAYNIYCEYKEEFWEIFKIILCDLWKLNSQMGFSQVSLRYGIEFLNDYEKYERNEYPKKTSSEYYNIGFNCLLVADHLNKNSDGLEICKKIFDRKIYDKNNRTYRENDIQLKPEEDLTTMQFFAKYCKFITKSFTDEKIKNYYYEWVSYYRNLFDDKKYDLIEDKEKKMMDIISDIEKGEIKDFKLYFEMLMGYFNNLLPNSTSNLYDLLKNDNNEEKNRNLRYLYIFFKDEIFY